MCIDRAITAAYDTINDYIQRTEQEIIRLGPEGDTERVEDMRTRITLLKEVKHKIMTRMENQTGVKDGQHCRHCKNTCGS